MISRMPNLTLALLLTRGLSTFALADVPTTMDIQGVLTDSSGTPVPAGLKIFTFKIFDAEVGGTEIWPAAPGENIILTTDDAGLWNACVGENIPLTEAVFISDTSRWLELTVDDGVNPPETMSRIKLKTHPYSYRSASSDQAANADLIDGLDGSDLAPGESQSQWHLRIDISQSCGIICTNYPHT